MKLKFLKSVPVKKSKETPQGAYQAGKEYEVADLHAAETYVAHGYASYAEGAIASGGTKPRTLGARPTEAKSEKGNETV